MRMAAAAAGLEGDEFVVKDGITWAELEAFAPNASVEALFQEGRFIARSSQWVDGLRLLEELLLVQEHSGVEKAPKWELFQNALHACANAGQWQQATNLLLRMPFEDLQPTLDTLDIVLRTDPPKAVADTLWRYVLDPPPGLLEEDPERLRQKKLVALAHLQGCAEALTALEAEEQPGDLELYNDLLGACGQGGCWELSLQLLDKMQRHELLPDGRSFDGAISACEGAGKDDLVLELQRVSAEAGVSLRPVALRACEGARARREPGQANEASKAGAEQDEVTASAAQAAEASDDAERQAHTAAEPDAAEQQVDAAAPNDAELPNPAAQAPAPEESLTNRVLAFCSDPSVQPERKDFDAAAQIFANATGIEKKAPLLLLLKMRNFDLLPTDRVYNGAIAAAVRLEAMAEAYVFFNSMRDLKLRPDALGYASALQFLTGRSDIGDLAEAGRLWKEAVHRGHKDGVSQVLWKFRREAEEREAALQKAAEDAKWEALERQMRREKMAARREERRRHRERLKERRRMRGLKPLFRRKNIFSGVRVTKGLSFSGRDEDDDDDDDRSVIVP